MTLKSPTGNQLFRDLNFARSPVSRGNCPVQLFNTLMEQISNDDMNYFLALAAATGLQIMNLAKTGIPESFESHSRLIRKATELIDRNYTTPGFNINALADMMDVNRSSLCRSFSRIMSMTPLEYLMHARITRAADLLRGPYMPLTEICRLSGFCNQVSFIRAFERYFHKTPTQFRDGMP